MAFSLLSYERLSALIDGEEISAGSLEVPFTQSVDGEVYDRTESIANAANAVMYDNTLAGFSYLRIVSDYNTRILVTDNASNVFSFALVGTGVAGKYGPAFKLHSDDTNTSSVIVNAVQAFNTSGNTAKVKIIVVK